MWCVKVCVCYCCVCMCVSVSVYVCVCVFTVPRIRPKVWYPTSLLSLPSGIKVLSLGAVLVISEIDEDIPRTMEG